MATIIDVHNLAVELLNKTYEIVSFNGSHHTVNPAKDLGYTFKFDNSKRRFGCCNYSRKTISLSKELCRLNLDKIDGRIKDCILHEISHAICVHIYGRIDGRGHGENWREILLTLGGDGRRCYDGNKVNKPKAKYTLTCPTCEKEASRHRMPKNGIACGSCCDGEYNEEHRFIVTQNH